MIYEWNKSNFRHLKALFECYQHTRAIIFPALEQGRGTIWVDDLNNPLTARLLVGVINFFAGDSCSSAARELIASVQQLDGLVGPTDDWNKAIKEVWSNRLEVQFRTCFSAESLDIDYLRSLQTNIGGQYRLERVDLKTVRRLDKREHMHIPVFFGSSEKFIKNGIGFCIKHKGKVVSIATTFTPFIDEFEIQVNTVDNPLYRRKGLATAVSAALIAYGLEHGLKPQWDAANEISVKLAFRLGFANPTQWNAFYVKPRK